MWMLLYITISPRNMTLFGLLSVTVLQITSGPINKCTPHYSRLEEYFASNYMLSLSSLSFLFHLSNIIWSSSTMRPSKGIILWHPSQEVLRSSKEGMLQGYFIFRWCSRVWNASFSLLNRGIWHIWSSFTGLDPPSFIQTKHLLKSLFDFG